MTNEDKMTLRRGDRFLHRRLLDPSRMPEKVPQLCLVTAVRQGVVHYRPDYGTHDDGSPWLGGGGYFPIEEIERWAEPTTGRAGNRRLEH